MYYIFSELVSFLSLNISIHLFNLYVTNKLFLIFGL